MYAKVLEHGAPSRERLAGPQSERFCCQTNATSASSQPVVHKDLQCAPLLAQSQIFRSFSSPTESSCCEAIDRVTQSLWRGVEGTSAMLILPMLFGAFLGSHTGTLYPYDG